MSDEIVTKVEADVKSEVSAIEQKAQSFYQSELLKVKAELAKVKAETFSFVTLVYVSASTGLLGLIVGLVLAHKK